MSDAVHESNTSDAQSGPDAAGELVIRVREIAEEDGDHVGTTTGKGEDGQADGVAPQAEEPQEHIDANDVRTVLYDDADFRHADGEHLTDEQVQKILEQADVGWLQTCCICRSDCSLSEVLPTPCGEHWICHGCTPLIFQAAINSESNYPPRCCPTVASLNIVDFEHIIEDASLVQVYKAKTEEYRTNAMFRRYCANDNCRRFLPVTSYTDVDDGRVTVADCGTCRKTNCIGCKSIIGKHSRSAHKCTYQAPELKTDYNRTEIISLESGKMMRMRACPKCGEAIELYDACNHMTCRCGYDFCFICLLPLSGKNRCHGTCPQYGDPPCDSEGYYDTGFHRDTGLDRQGFNGRGINVRGLNRSGQRVEDFAYISENRHVDGTVNHLEDLLELDRGLHPVAAMLGMFDDLQQNTMFLVEDVERYFEQHFGHDNDDNDLPGQEDVDDGW